MNDRTYIKAASKIEQFMDGALDKELSAAVKKKATVGGLCMAIPFYGIETIVYAICLWNTYKKVAEVSTVPFKDHAVGNVIAGFIVNIIVTFVLGLIMELIPGLIISCIGSYVVGYASLEISGMAYVKALKTIYGNKSRTDLNVTQGINQLKGDSQKGELQV